MPSSPSPPSPPSESTRQPHPFLVRLEHMTFAWFTSCMSLGGMANLLIARIIDSSGLYYLGVALFFINIAYLLLLVTLQIVRYTCTRASVSYTLTHPIECCFVPTALLACATVINGFAGIVGGDASFAWEVVLRAAFWVYFVASFVVSLVCYTCLFARSEQSLHHMNPAWVLPIFPLMLCGSVASAVVPTQGELSALVMAICGLTCQGLGFTVSCMMYAVLLLRLMTVSYPPARARPGLFMNCGPPAFTILCLMGLSSEMQRILPALPTPLPLPPTTYETLSIVALASSILLWAISAWFYMLTVSALVQVAVEARLRREMEFILAWWACVFPITGFAMATNEIGEALASRAVRGVAQGMVVWLAVVFVGVATMHVRAVWTRGIMWEGKDEDRVIDTMYHRVEFGGSGDLEKAHHEHAASHETQLDNFHKHQQQQQDHGRQHDDDLEAHSPYSNPPTYPSTPAVSVRRLSTKKDAEPKQRCHDDDDDVDNIQPLPPSSSSSSSSAATTPWSSQLRMTPLSSSP
ncbi:related to Malic acid transport protein [Sporisorium reilianum SRZ2]|uniref:Related to Malic acid transport protein n=1 Tax=Sporisorium reilianum (strain SRZ2) TaxID=999809 RepID=E6ZQX0_SPORE|nr:related to Malic acid transport protein [Sporisorium reilianum SRZ2]